jgi:hypothetical protein
MAKKRKVEDVPAEPAAPVKPQFSAEGVLLNPEHFTVTAEGLLKPKTA